MRNIEERKEASILQTERKSIIPDNFELPNLSKLPEGKDEYQTEKASFKFDYLGHEYQAEIEFVLSSSDSPLHIRLDIIDNDIRAASFMSEFCQKGNKLICRFHFRKVEIPYRGKKLGVLGIRTMDEIIKRTSDKYSDFKVDEILIMTRISSLVKILTNENNNLRYEYEPKDDQKVQKILESQTSDVFDPKITSSPKMKFFKKI